MVYAQSHVFMVTCVHGQHQGSSSVTLHLILWDKIPHWPWSFSILPRRSVQQAPAPLYVHLSPSLRLGLQMCSTTTGLMWCWRWNPGPPAQVASTCSTRPPPQHLCRLCVFTFSLHCKVCEEGDQAWLLRSPRRFSNTAWYHLVK